MAKKPTHYNPMPMLAGTVVLIGAVLLSRLFIVDNGSAYVLIVPVAAIFMTLLCGVEEIIRQFSSTGKSQVISVVVPFLCMISIVWAAGLIYSF